MSRRETAWNLAQHAWKVNGIHEVPPAPPTAGPTYLAEIESVEIQRRGRYNVNGSYWPVRGRVRGGVKIEMTNILQLGVLGNPEKQPSQAVDFVEEARLSKNDFGNWRAAYDYDAAGPRWRLERSEAPEGPK